jgi:hypothetical protein
MSYIVRVVGPTGFERYLALRMVERPAADVFGHPSKAWEVADAVKSALGNVYVDVIDTRDAEARVPHE